MADKGKGEGKEEKAMAIGGTLEAAAANRAGAKGVHGRREGSMEGENQAATAADSWVTRAIFANLAQMGSPARSAEIQDTPLQSVTQRTRQREMR